MLGVVVSSRLLDFLGLRCISLFSSTSPLLKCVNLLHNNLFISLCHVIRWQQTNNRACLSFTFPLQSSHRVHSLLHARACNMSVSLYMYFETTSPLISLLGHHQILVSMLNKYVASIWNFFSQVKSSRWYLTSQSVPHTFRCKSA